MKTKTAPEPISMHLPTAIRQAVADARKLSKNSRKYRLDMDVWIEKTKESVQCHVCLAGAMMVSRLPHIADEVWRHDDVWFTPNSTGDAIVSTMVNAINDVRSGWLGWAVEDTGFKFKPGVYACDCPHTFDKDKPESHAHLFRRMLKIADWLEENEDKSA